MYTWDGFNFFLCLASFVISSSELTLLNANKSEICGFAPQFFAVGYMQVSQEGQTLNRITKLVKKGHRSLQNTKGNAVNYQVSSRMTDDPLHLSSFWSCAGVSS